MRCVSLFGVLSRSLKECCVLLNQQMWVVLFGSAPFFLSTLTLDGASLNVDGCVVASHLFSCDASVCDLCSPLSRFSSSLVFDVSPRFTALSLITLFSRCHTCWCGERGHRFHDSSSALLRVSVPFCSIVVSHCRVRGVVPQRWMPPLGHGWVMVHRAGHSRALLLLCCESVSMLCGWKPSVASMCTSSYQLLLGTFHS